MYLRLEGEIDRPEYSAVIGLPRLSFRVEKEPISSKERSV
jgi:hypothetical protein